MDRDKLIERRQQLFNELKQIDAQLLTEMVSFDSNGCPMVSHPGAHPIETPVKNTGFTVMFKHALPGNGGSPFVHID